MFIPKLHLPPWFHEGWAELVEQKEWFGAGFIEIAEGTFVQPMFTTLDRIRWDLKSAGFFADREMIIVESTNIDNLRRLIPEMHAAGVFNKLTKFDAAEWEEVVDIPLSNSAPESERKNK